MSELAGALENTAFAIWLKESPSPFAYTGFLFLHATGLALAVGMSFAVNLRILGRAGSLPLAPMAGLFPLIWLGLSVNAVSGMGLLVANATNDLTNPVFYVKLAAIACAVTTAVMIRRRVFDGRDPAALDQPARRAVPLARLSIALWILAIAAGRLVEYPELLGLR
jgi:hypothetical protein